MNGSGAVTTRNGMRYLTHRLDYSANRPTLFHDVRKFNSMFEPGMALDVLGDDVFLYIHSVKTNDLDLFKHQLKCGKLAAEISDTISGIRSYGYENGTKQFVDYNVERKTKDRVRKSGIRLGSQTPSLTAENNEMPDMFQNKMICGDSLRVLKKIPDNSVDIIFTSPPYNFGLDYSEGDDAQRWDVYFQKLFGIIDECVRVLKHGGRFLINVQPLFSDYIPTHHKISEYITKKQDMMWKGEIMWEKNNYNCKYTAWGSWQSPSSPYLKYTWEFVEVFCKGAMKKPGKSEDIDIAADDFKKWVYAKWSIAPERNMRQYDHPAMFPEELAKRALQLFSYKNDIVLDPFMGVGTTCCVARRLGRRYLGIDVSKEYVRKATNRILGQLP